MQYDPMNTTHRRMLAEGVLGTVKSAGLRAEEQSNCFEEVFSLPVKERLSIKVYTSVDKRDGLIRSVGADAIRVCTVYNSRSGAVRGVGKETRVHRVGDINMIIVRMAERLNASLKAANSLPCCVYCGAPNFKSKNGNMVCSDICWKN